MRFRSEPLRKFLQSLDIDGEGDGETRVDSQVDEESR